MYFVAMMRAGGRPHSGSGLPRCGASGSRVPEDQSSLAHPYMSDPNSLSLDQRLLTAQDVADLLSVPRSSVYEYARRQHNPLPSIPIGRHRRFHRKDVETWLSARRCSTSSGDISDLETTPSTTRVPGTLIGRRRLSSIGIRQRHGASTTDLLRQQKLIARNVNHDTASEESGGAAPS